MRTATADSATYTSDVRVIGKCPWCKTPVAGVAHIETTQRATISGVVTMSRVVGGSAKYRDPRRPQYGYVVDHACPEITDEVSVYVQVKPVSGTVTAKACHEFDSVVRRYLGGRYNVLVVCAELALLLPPEDPNA